MTKNGTNAIRFNDTKSFTTISNLPIDPTTLFPSQKKYNEHQKRLNEIEQKVNEKWIELSKLKLQELKDHCEEENLASNGRNSRKSDLIFKLLDKYQASLNESIVERNNNRSNGNNDNSNDNNNDNSVQLTAKSRGDYDGMTVRQLQDYLRAKELKVTGKNKLELINRLKEYDSSIKDDFDTENRHLLPTVCKINICV